ncbi:MAG TPA: 7TM domain-containing protein [Gemmataceae bacterium]|nr:7TM domain-containing protein [Gemmataceae bacterium]
MSRTTLCVITAAGLAAASVGLMIGRCYVLGDEVKTPVGPGAWKVALVVHGKTTGSDARLTTAIPLDFGRQHILNELCRSNELLSKPPDAKHPERHQVLWSQRAGVAGGPFRALYQFQCTVNVNTPTTSMSKLSRTLYAPPQREEPVASPEIPGSSVPEISALARNLTSRIDSAPDQLEALYRYVDQEVGNEPTVEGSIASPLECLKNGTGDSGAKSRLLAALCQNRGIPARLVTGLALKTGHEQNAHVWVEAFVKDRWVSACSVYHHLGRVPPSYLIFHYGDSPLVRGRGVRDLHYAFLVERMEAEGELDAANSSRLHHVLAKLSLYALPPTEQRLVEFLLLLPIAALIICIYRNIIGIGSFGTFAPALVGLAFRDLGGLPGILVFISIVLIGWLMRRVLNYYHLLQVPRMAFLLSLVVIVLITAIVAANYQDMPATKYISLFPMVILTGMIERFWTLEVEDGTTSSFKTLLGTMVIAASISLVLSLHAVVRHMFHFPETLGLIMAVQLLIGRYTGYRLSELFRFRDFLPPRPITPESVPGVSGSA